MMKWLALLGFIAVGCAEIKEDTFVKLDPVPATVAETAESKPNTSGITVRAKWSEDKGLSIVFTNTSNKPVVAYLGRDSQEFEITSERMNIWRAEPWIEVKRGSRPEESCLKTIEAHASVEYSPRTLEYYKMNPGQYTANLHFDDSYLVKEATEQKWHQNPSMGKTAEIPLLLTVDAFGNQSAKPIK